MPKKLEIKPGQDFSIGLFTPEDAPGVAALFKDVYGNGYPVKTYLEPDLLIRENRAGRIISTVARTVNNDIIGHSALYNSAPCSKVYESGAALVHKAYRGGHGIASRMVDYGNKVGPEKFSVEQVFGEPVTNHPFTQKMGRKSGFVTRAIEVSLMPAEAYIKEDSARGRVSALLDFKTFKPRSCRVYVPKIYDGLFPFFYADMDDDRAFVISTQSLSTGEKTLLKTQVFDFAKVARVAIHALGADFDDCFKVEEHRLLQSGIRVIQVWLSTGIPSVGDAADLLRQKGYFFSGVLPRWFDNDGMLMTKLLDEPDWQSMVLHFDRAREMADIVRSDWEKVRHVVKSTMNQGATDPGDVK